ncbi:MAG: hypothetical protein LBC12_00810 [Nitrososphaerota archaeon]|jgi:hypothetical protein|nr:hypothetical protein [Nitrososphaerota archaeon]
MKIEKKVVTLCVIALALGIVAILPIVYKPLGTEDPTQTINTDGSTMITFTLPDGSTYTGYIRVSDDEINGLNYSISEMVPTPTEKLGE